MKPEMLKKLRDGETLRLFDNKSRMFHQFQLNKNEDFICWKYFISYDKQNWVEQNTYLSLHDVDKLLTKIKN